MRILKKGAVIIAACILVSLYILPVYAVSYSLNYTDNGDAYIYDEEKQEYVDADEYHAAFRYAYSAEQKAYGLTYKGVFRKCNCAVCKHLAQGHKIIVPNDTEVYIAGKLITKSSGNGWTYNEDTNTLTLNSFKYSGPGTFIKDEEAEDEDYDDDSEDEDYDDDSEDEETDDEDWDDDEDYEEEYKDEYFDEDLIVGVIYSSKGLNLHINGISEITVTDKTDPDHIINAEKTLNIEGDGTLYVNSVDGRQVYGTVIETENTETSSEQQSSGSEESTEGTSIIPRNTTGSDKTESNIDETLSDTDTEEEDEKDDVESNEDNVESEEDDIENEEDDIESEEDDVESEEDDVESEEDDIESEEDDVTNNEDDTSNDDTSNNEISDDTESKSLITDKEETTSDIKNTNIGEKISEAISGIIESVSSGDSSDTEDETSEEESGEDPDEEARDEDSDDETDEKSVEETITEETKKISKIKTPQTGEDLDRIFIIIISMIITGAMVMVYGLRKIFA